MDQYAVGAFDHAIDDGGQIWAEYGIVSQPAFAFINDDGTVETTGGLGGDRLAEEVEALIAG